MDMPKYASIKKTRHMFGEFQKMPFQLNIMTLKF